MRPMIDANRVKNSVDMRYVCMFVAREDVEWLGSIVVAVMDVCTAVLEDHIVSNVRLLTPSLKKKDHQENNHFLSSGTYFSFLRLFGSPKKT